ncbi:MAG: methionine--tRNA ligase [Hydrogenophilus sp.]|nr:methionine--tRNA ligase [Hydrogenophilus sp.]
MNPRRILVTNALPYANGDIHLGHLVGYIQADIWVRYQRLCGHTVHYVCADDTHGTPVMLRAEKEGISPEQLIERMRHAHLADFTDFLIAFDHYHTTHSDENRQWAETIYRRLKAAGLIVQRDIEQLFDPIKKLFLPDRYVRGTCPRCRASDQYGDHCERCGAAYAPTDLLDPYSALSGAKPQLARSTHYFFCLSHPDVAAFLRRWTRSHDRHGFPILPAEAQHKLDEWLGTETDPRLTDWDISRDAPYFGFPIPDAPGKYFYVWLDAPIGYFASFTAYARARQIDAHPYFDPAAAEASGTELVHFIGKDILYFHALFWPAMLHFAGLRTPTREYINGFLTVDGAKMSKSRGTFITARSWLDLGLDPEWLRYYYAAKNNGTPTDIDLALDDLVAKINSDLVGKYVNIAARLIGFIHNHFAGRLGSSDLVVLAPFRDATTDASLHAAYERADTAAVIRQVQELLDLANAYINQQQPWNLAKSGDHAQLHTVVTTGLTMFRDLTRLLKPILPRTAQRVEALFAIPPLDFTQPWAPLPLGHAIHPYQPLHTRLDRRRLDTLLEINRETLCTSPSLPPSSAAPSSVPSPASASPASPLRADPPPTSAAPAAPSSSARPAVPTITIDQFAQLDLRVGRITAAETIPEAEKLLKLTVDLGEQDAAGSPRLRTIFAGIKAHYAPETLLGRLVVVVANLAPRKMRFGLSEGMVLAASDESGETPGIFLLSPDSGAQPGMRVK